MAADDILEVLDARGLSVAPEIQERVRAEADMDQLRRWLRRAAVVESANGLFVE